MVWTACGRSFGRASAAAALPMQRACRSGAPLPRCPGLSRCCTLSLAPQGVFGALAVINSFPGERALTLRERASGMYYASGAAWCRGGTARLRPCTLSLQPATRPSCWHSTAAPPFVALAAYYLAKSTAEAALYVVAPLAFSCIAYWMVGLQVRAEPTPRRRPATARQLLPCSPPSMPACRCARRLEPRPRHAPPRPSPPPIGCPPPSSRPAAAASAPLSFAAPGPPSCNLLLPNSSPTPVSAAATLLARSPWPPSFSSSAPSWCCASRPPSPWRRPSARCAATSTPRVGGGRRRATAAPLQGLPGRHQHSAFGAWQAAPMAAHERQNAPCVLWGCSRRCS